MYRLFTIIGYQSQFENRYLCTIKDFKQGYATASGKMNHAA